MEKQIAELKAQLEELAQKVDAMQNKATADSLDLRCARIMKDVGIPVHLLGYRYIITALRIVIEEQNGFIESVSNLYIDIAKRHHTTPSKVERAIRHAVENAYERGDEDVLRDYFGNTISALSGKPTNGQFICTIVEHLMLEGYGK